MNQESPSPSFLVFMNALNSVTQFLLGAVTLSGFLYGAAYRGSLSIGSIVVVSWWSSYAQHIFLCVTGYVILMCQAMLAFNPYAGWATNLQHSHKKVVHIAMQIGGSILAIVGSSIKMLDRDPSLSSAHAYFGFFAMLLTVSSLIGGVLNYKFSQKNERMTVLKLLHACLGCLTITFAFITMIIAYANHSDGVCVAFTVLALIGILASIFTKTFANTIRNFF